MSRDGKAEGNGFKYETGNGELRCILMKPVILVREALKVCRGRPDSDDSEKSDGWPDQTFDLDMLYSIFNHIHRICPFCKKYT
jgi:hypothetical protein